MSQQLTHFKQKRNTDYLGAYDLCVGAEDNGREKFGTLVATISHIVEAEEVIEPSTNKKQPCVVVYWKEPNIKKMILNVTNQKAIATVAGSGFFEYWKNKRVKLFVDPKVRQVGEKKGSPNEYGPALRIHNVAVAEDKIKCEVCGKDTDAKIWQQMKNGIGAGVCSVECKDKYNESKGV